MILLLFVNKPLTLVFYLLGLGLLALLAFMHSHPLAWVGFFISIFAFSVFYFTSLTYYYFLKGDEKFEIKGVDIRIFQKSFIVYWIFSLIGWVASSIALINGAIPFALFFLLTFYNAICAIALRCYVYAKFFSMALKKNPSLKNFRMEDFYQDIREILLKKIIN